MKHFGYATSLLFDVSPIIDRADTNFWQTKFMGIGHQLQNDKPLKITVRQQIGVCFL